MKTTLDIDDALLAAAEKKAAATGVSLVRVIEEALRIGLADNPPNRRPLILPSDGIGGLLPGVDLSCNERVRDIMDGLD